MTKIDSKNVLLFIHPTSCDTKEPLIDKYTIAVCNALENNESTGFVNGNKFIKGIRTMGYHLCSGCLNEQNRFSCPKSKGYDFEIADELYTNWLAVHYLAYHRNEVPDKELKKIDKHLDTINNKYNKEFMEIIVNGKWK